MKNIFVLTDNPGNVNIRGHKRALLIYSGKKKRPEIGFLYIMLFFCYFLSVYSDCKFTDFLPFVLNTLPMQQIASLPIQ